MSYLILGPVSQSLSRGRLVLPVVAGCCCKCHARVCSRALSTQTAPWNGHTHRKREKSSRPHRPHQQQTQLQPFSIHSSFFKSKYLLHSGTPASLFGTIHDDRPLLRLSSAINVCDARSLFSNYMVASSFHSSGLLLREESKVEKSVKALKQKVEQALKKGDAEKLEQEQQVAKPEVVAAALPKKSLGQRFVAELKHYYHGFRLLLIDIRICIRLLWNMANGKSLTRRERRQLVRTTADLFRLVPFSVFLLVPFMELLLPVFVKLFPSMLPSTFAEENQQQEKLKKQLKAKLELAKFLQLTIRETALQKKKKKGSAAEEFSNFVAKIRSEGIRPTTDEILKFAKLFEDEITLDNLSRQQLQAVCRVLGIQPIGIDALLRFQLDMKLRQLKADDKMIKKEGLDSLTMNELQAANRARGMRALGVSHERLTEQLQQWLTLHLEEQIPTSLLLLSRALYLPETLSTEEQLTATITELTAKPSTTEEVKLKAAELAGEDVDNKTRLDIIKHEEDIIAAETKARQDEEAAEQEEKARQVQGEREAAEALAGQAAMDTKTVSTDEALISETAAKSEELVDKAPEMVGLPGEDLKEPAKEKGKEEGEEEHVTAKELEEIETALEEIAEHKQFNIKKEELQDLKQEVDEYREDLQDLKEVMVLTGAEHDPMVESKASQRLAKRVDRLIHQADTVMTELQAEKERFQEEIEVGEVRLKRSAELKADEKQAEEVLLKISESKDNIVSINEMLLAMKRLYNDNNVTKCVGCQGQHCEHQRDAAGHEATVL
ncbi:mitochondrial proton/calcium exchanger protein-like isoform X2 [Littorina saxatilis]|uniref:mitochondrial proton/calcium exchanger protein-like isoform X2 n=1 Tax=Littorina saxatilis TaxID=31220 RepID=UPI0038B61982